MRHDQAFAAHAPQASSSAVRHWQAQLSLGFAQQFGASRMIERSHSGPLRVQKPLYPEGPEVCHAIVVHPPGGVVGGDQLTINTTVGSGAQALIATPGAAKWYRANGQRSRQSVRIDVAAQGACEWLPQETIFFDAADVQLEHSVNLEQDAAYIGCEILCFGRTASGENFETGRIAQRNTIRVDGRMIWFEQGTVLGTSEAMQGPLALAGNTVCGTLIAVGKSGAAGQMNAAMHAIREEAVAITGNPHCVGVSQTKAVVVTRYLGHSSETARQVMLCAWQKLRPLLLGREAVVPRIWHT